MSTTIELRCPCGGTFKGTGSEYINGGGAKDAKNRVFVIELRADEWQDSHARCLVKRTEPERQEPT